MRGKHRRRENERKCAEERVEDKCVGGIGKAQGAKSEGKRTLRKGKLVKRVVGGKCWTRGSEGKVVKVKTLETEGT